jgi:N,N'-diacetyllegionaminate synthase
MEKVFIVAEIGVAWNGSLQAAKKMIEFSAKAGADTVKFQIFSENEIRDSPHYEKLKEMILDKETLKVLKTCAEVNKVEFFASAMYPEAIDLLMEVDCDYIKLREKDSTNYLLIDKALETNKAVFISTTQRPLELKYLWHPQILWFYCLPYYPPNLEQFDLNDASTYHGVSSHFPHYTLDLAAASLSLSQYNKPYVIEKHVMIDFPEWTIKGTVQFPEWEKPIDAPVSITFNQLKELVTHVRRLEKLPIQE